MKALTKGTNPRTPKQMVQRGFMSQMGALWRSISTADQADWDAFAATPPEDDYTSLGDLYLLSGFGWFSRICLRRQRTGQAEDLEAPASVPTAPPTTFDMELHPATGVAANASFEYTNGEFATDYAILQLSLAPGVGSNVQTSRYLNCWEALGIGATKTEFGVNYFEAFGSTQLLTRYFGRLFRQSPEGIRSTPLEVFVDVIA